MIIRGLALLMIFVFAGCAPGTGEKSPPVPATSPGELWDCYKSAVANLGNEGSDEFEKAALKGLTLSQKCGGSEEQVIGFLSKEGKL